MKPARGIRRERFGVRLVDRSRRTLESVKPPLRLASWQPPETKPWVLGVDLSRHARLNLGTASGTDIESVAWPQRLSLRKSSPPCIPRTIGSWRRL